MNSNSSAVIFTAPLHASKLLIDAYPGLPRWRLRLAAVQREHGRDQDARHTYLEARKYINGLPAHAQSKDAAQRYCGRGRTGFGRAAIMLKAMLCSFAHPDVVLKEVRNEWHLLRHKTPSFRRRPEPSKSLNSLDPGLHRDDTVLKSRGDTISKSPCLWTLTRFSKCGPAG